MWGRGWGGGTRAAAALRFIWSVTFEAFRDFVWGDLKDGVLDLHGLELPVRALVWLGFTMLVVITVTLPVSDAWRETFDLVPLTQGIPGRGRLIPSALLPATMFLLVVAWSFALAGALRARWLIRFSALTLYLLSFISSLDSQILANAKALLVAVGAIVGLLVLFGVAWRTRPRPAAEFLAVLMLVGSSAAVTQAEGLTSWRLSGLPLIVSRVNLDVTGLTTLITPLLLLVGLGVAGFAAKLAGWSVDIVEDRLPRPTTFVLLVLAIAWQVWQVVPPSLDRFRDSPKTESLSMLNALGVLAIVGLCWLVATRLAARVRPATDVLTVEEVSGSVDRWSAPLVVA